MRENVVEELRQLRTDDSTKQKTLDILKRFHSEEEMEDFDEDEDGMLLQTLVCLFVYLFLLKVKFCVCIFIAMKL